MMYSKEFVTFAAVCFIVASIAAVGMVIFSLKGIDDEDL